MDLPVIAFGLAFVVAGFALPVVYKDWPGWRGPLFWLPPRVAIGVPFWLAGLFLIGVGVFGWGEDVPR